MEDNIYIRTLRIGASKIEEGVSYDEIYQILNSEGYKLEGQLELSFRNWFLKTFFNEDIHRNIDNPKQKASILNSPDVFKLYRARKMHLTGEGYLSFLDYEELNQARVSSEQSNINARKAIRVAIFAISISGLLAIASICISLFDMLNDKFDTPDIVSLRSQLQSDEPSVICETCYKLGELKDFESVQLLSEDLDDPRFSHDIRYKGMSVYQCRIIALDKILDLHIDSSFNYRPDSNIIRSVLSQINK